MKAAFFIIIFWFLPPVLYVSFNFSSQFIPLFISFLVWFLLKQKVNFSSNLKYLILFLFFYSIWGFFVSGNLFRILTSFIAYSFILVSSNDIINEFLNISYKVKYLRAIAIVFLFVLAIDLIFNFQPGNYSELNSPIFPFYEPSHFFLAFFPFCVLVFMKKNLLIYKIAILCFLIIFQLMEGSLIATILMLICIIVWLRKKQFYLFSSFMLIVIFVLNGSIENLDYYSSRLSGGFSNLTSGIWLLGWSETYYNLLDTYFFGLGFQNLGFSGHKSPQVLILSEYFPEFDSFNLRDGSFLFIKVVSEFGLIGFCFIFILYKSISTIKDLDVRITLILAITIELFFRSTGYFSITFLLVLSNYLYSKPDKKLDKC